MKKTCRSAEIKTRVLTLYGLSAQENKTHILICLVRKCVNEVFEILLDEPKCDIGHINNAHLCILAIACNMILFLTYNNKSKKEMIKLNCDEMYL